MTSKFVQGNLDSVQIKFRLSHTQQQQQPKIHRISKKILIFTTNNNGPNQFVPTLQEAT